MRKVFQLRLFSRYVILRRNKPVQGDAMEQKCTLQVGNMFVDGVIKLEDIIPDEVKKELGKRQRLYGAPFMPMPPPLTTSIYEDNIYQTYMAKFPIWGPAELPKVVEGSVAHPIDNPGQLLEGP